MKWKNLIISLVRWAISLALLGYAFSLIDFYGSEGFFNIIKEINLNWFIPFFLMLGGATFIVAGRWWLLLRAQEIRLSYFQVFRLTYLGHFFNLVMPGSLGGDLFTAVFIATTLKGTPQADLKTKAIISIVFDRFMGLISLSIISLGGVFASYQEEELIWLRGLILGFWIILLSVYLSYRLTRKCSLQLRLPFQIFFKEFSEAINTYHDKKKVVLKAIGLALIIQIGMIVINIAFAQAIGIKNVPLYYYFIFIPVISLIIALPISVGGWGVGEAGYGYFFALVGMNITQAVTLSILFRLSFMLWSLLGGLFLLGKGKRSK